MKHFLLIWSTVFAVLGWGQSKATTLPAISVIGDMVTTIHDEATTSTIRGVEMAFQHYLTPTVQADIFLGVHALDDGAYEWDIEEAFITANDPISLLLSTRFSVPGLGLIFGKKQVPIGILNTLHPEQWHFVDRPLVHQALFGADHALSGTGIAVNYTFPFPFFSQLTLGTWTMTPPHDVHADDNHADETLTHSHADGPTSEPWGHQSVTTRLWNSLAISPNQELSLGLNYMHGESSLSESRRMMGIDARYTNTIGTRTLQMDFETHVLDTDIAEETPSRGSMVQAHVDLTSDINLGVRYDYVNLANTAWNQTAYAITRRLTDTSRFRLQVTHGDETVVYAQFLFGMGPHSHGLR